ncbi:MAG: hypothetical protein ACRYG4_20445, partial [Janthinobacterium lividum]
IVECPCLPEPGLVYQRLVDSVRGDGFAYDLRTHVIGTEVVAVWVKQRAVADRFLPPNISAKSVAPESIFSAAELDSIGAFAKAMGADWCGLDILRDEPSGRIYIVDVNKTDAGPIIALPLSEKLASTRLLATALRRLVESQPAAGSSKADNASILASKAA